MKELHVRFQWLIPDFSDGGGKPRGGCHGIIWPFFPRKLFKLLRKVGREGGARLLLPLKPPLVWLRLPNFHYGKFMLNMNDVSDDGFVQYEFGISFV